MKQARCCGKTLNCLLIPVVAATLAACEGSDDSNDATWNRTEQRSADAPAQTEMARNDDAQTGSPSSPVAGDAIDPGSIRYLNANVSGWPVTSSLRVSINRSTVSMSYDKSRSWPAVGGLNANPWIIVNLNGQWTAATFEWFRQGQTSKPTSVVEGGHIKKAPLNNFRPVSGETYGWMVTSLARDSKRTVNERTNIVLARWP